MLSGIKNSYHPDHLLRIDSEIKKHGGNKELIKVKSNSLKKIFEDCSVKKVDYLSIDTEGSELEILSSIDFEKVDIRVISTENSSRKNIKEFLSDKGYDMLNVVCGDEIYCKK